MRSVSSKVWAGTIAAAVATILVAILRGVGVDVSAEVQGAITTILVFVAGYLKIDPERAS